MKSTELQSKLCKANLKKKQSKETFQGDGVEKKVIVYIKFAQINNLAFMNTLQGVSVSVSTIKRRLRQDKYRALATRCKTLAYYKKTEIPD